MNDSPSRRLLFPDGLAKTPGYTPVVEVRAERTVYISGQVPMDELGRLVGADDFEAQARRVFQNLGLALRSAEMDFSHLVKLGIYLTDMTHLPIMRRVRDEFIDPVQPPASTLIQVAALGHPKWLFEVDAVAASSE